MLKESNVVELEEFKEGFQAVIDQDFNPDFVQLFGIDMFESGFKKGLRYGIIGTVSAIGGYWIGNKLVRLFKKRNSDK